MPLGLLIALAVPSAPDHAQLVVFVCEHGSAKSVVAAAHFNRLAIERRLPFRAISRGVSVDPAVNPATERGLRADGLEADHDKPRRIESRDLETATKVIAFNPLPPDLAKLAKIEEWTDVPPITEDYEKARAAIVRRLNALLDQLAQQKSP